MCWWVCMYIGLQKGPWSGCESSAHSSSLLKGLLESMIIAAGRRAAVTIGGKNAAIENKQRKVDECLRNLKLLLVVPTLFTSNTPLCGGALGRGRLHLLFGASSLPLL